MYLLKCAFWHVKYLMVVDVNILLLYDNGLNFEHFTKEKHLFIREYCEKLLLGSPKIDKN